MSKEEMKRRLEGAKRCERHDNTLETRYWCDQYKQIATDAVAAQPEPTQEQIAGFDVVLDESMPPNTMKFVQPAPVQEAFWHAVVSKQAPVVDKAIRRLDVADEYAAQCRPHYPGVEVVPLYRATPPASQPAVPLTDEQILEIKAQFVWTLDFQFTEFARAIEAAHGITDAPEKGQP
jgi:hypothetical protein